MCCAPFLKLMMFIFNGSICLAGAAVLGVGIWLKVDSSSLLGILGGMEDADAEISQIASATDLFIGVGSVLLIIGFFGCCGAIQESRCMLLTFFCIVLIIFLAEVAGVVILFVFRDVAEQVFEHVEEKVVEDIKREYGNEGGLTSSWNTIMTQFQCCGYNNYTNFEGSPFNVNGSDVYPPTCCYNHGGVCSDSQAGAANVEGCFTKLIKLLEDNALLVAAVAIGIAAIEIAAMVVSMVLYKQIGS